MNGRERETARELEDRELSMWRNLMNQGRLEPGWVTVFPDLIHLKNTDLNLRQSDYSFLN